jgi:hypothetical protein
MNSYTKLRKMKELNYPVNIYGAPALDSFKEISFLQYIYDISTNVTFIILVCKGRHRKVN